MWKEFKEYTKGQDLKALRAKYEEIDENFTTVWIDEQDENQV